MKKINVEGIQKPYNVYIRNNLYQEIGTLFDKYNYKHIYVIHDNNVDIGNLGDLLIVEGILSFEITEKDKTFDGVRDVLDFLNINNVRKNNTLVVVIGGGVLLDLIGFSTSIYMRGIDVAYVPTTLLSMVDASIGSKNAIDFENIKNLVGTFYDPKFVLIDPIFLKTLPARQLKSGIAEVIKIGYITGGNVLGLMDNIYDADYNWVPLIFLCVTLKNEIISKDYNDQGARKFLNFGHTFGHALESYYDFEKYTHGEAIAIGMALFYPSHKLINDLNRFDIYTKLDDDLNYKEIWKIMKKDKKRDQEHGVNIITLLEVGKPAIDFLEDEFELLKKIERLRLVNEEVAKS